METLSLPASSSQALPRALQLLQDGELVAFPTDTVYGLGASLHNPASIARLYQVKDRELSKAIAVLLGSLADLELVAQGVSETARRLSERFWPGPLTLVVPRRPDLPEMLSPSQTIGVRMPDHPLALALLRQSGPLAVTSANLSGGANALTAGEVLAQLEGRIPLILDGGPSPGGSPSTVVDCTGSTLVILRPGPISLEELMQALP
jgi:L-threonylcarbamoyladenylate synthase